MKIFTKVMLLVIVGLCGLCTAQAEAASIPGLFNTGVNSSNALLAPGTVDPHYTLISSADPSFPPPNAVVVGPSTVIPGFPFSPGPWLPDGPNSMWIGPQVDVLNLGGNSPGVYTYETTFDLTGLNPATAVITGQWAADNAGTNILINGASTGITTPNPGFGSFQAFTISSGFVSGLNTLDFVVNNIPNTDPSPTGLRVELSGTASVPEPVSLLFLGAGLVGLAVIGRKNQNVN